MNQLFSATRMLAIASALILLGGQVRAAEIPSSTPQVGSQLGETSVQRPAASANLPAANSKIDSDQKLVAHYAVPLPNNIITLTSGTSELFTFPSTVVRVWIANSKVADVRVMTPQEVMLVGHAKGFTTLGVWTLDGRYEARQVRIDESGPQQVMIDVMVAEVNRSELENQGIDVAAALTHYGVSLVSLPGQVASPFTQGSSSTSGGSTLPSGGNLLPLLLSNNVTYGVSGQNSNVQTNAVFQFLESHGMARILAQPQLMANSGERAKFLSGGEIPIVVAQALNTSVVFKQFGTSVSFLPTVIGDDRIQLEVAPEVSKPDFSQGVQLFGFQVPAFLERRVETEVQLNNGQTLIVAGLILHDTQAVVAKVPYLGELPFVGALFRHTSYQESDTDLVMAVTPQIVRPLPPGTQVAMPNNYRPLLPEDIKTGRQTPSDPSRPRF